MSGRGFSRGGGRGGDRGGGGRGGFRGGGRGGFQQRDMGPPDAVYEMGTCVHAVEEEMLCIGTMPEKVPYFNAPIYLENKNVIGKVDEVLGPVNEVYFTVKMESGMVATRFQKGDKVYIAGDKTLPIQRFLPQPKVMGGKIEKRGAGRGGPRGARGGRGAPRGRGGLGGRGGFGGARGGFGAPRGGSFRGGSDRGGHGGRGGFSRGGPGGRGRGRGF